MSKFIDVYSGFRDKTSQPNPANFTIRGDQVDTWFKFNRQTGSYGIPAPAFSGEFAVIMRLTSFVMPYTTNVGGIDLSSEPVLYVNLDRHSNPSLRLIDGIDGKQADSKFVCRFDKYQEDDTNTRVWIHYKCDMTQVFSFNRDTEIDFTVRTREETVIQLNLLESPVGDPPDPTVQVFATFELKPYYRDARDYSAGIEYQRRT